MRVGEVMTTPAVTVAPEASVSQVAQRMLDHNVRALPVVDGDGKLLGIITDTDLLVRNARLHFPSYLGILENLLPIGGDRNLEDELRRVLATTAQEVMTPKVRTSSPDNDLGDVAHEMIQHHLHAVPVLKDGKLEGILFPRDVIRLIARD
ncbi:MAG: CBS domain-containing protein [Chloroflexi bacterium]|nr:CBS domain-containing protein [Chloroflexota bacterium]